MRFVSRGVAAALVLFTVGAAASPVAAGSETVEVPTPGGSEPRDAVVAEFRAGQRRVSARSATPVMGPSVLTAIDLAEWYRSKGHTPQLPGVRNSVRRLAQLFIDEGTADGVRGDLAFVQSAVETGWFTFPSFGQIRPEFFNYSGLNAFGGRPRGTTCEAETAPSRCFESPRIGIRNQIHLLRSYADPSVADVDGRLRYAPRDRRGIAPNWEDFGWHPPAPLIWAATADYGNVIVGLFNGALSFSGVPTSCLETITNDGEVGRGYWVVEDGGAVHGIGRLTQLADVTTEHRVVAGEPARGGGAYVLTDDGVVHAQSARHYGDAHNPAYSWVGFERTRRGYGYWLLSADGRVYEYGSADFYGSPRKSRAVIDDAVAIERTASGDGYWVATASGRVFSFGDAVDFGEFASAPTSPIVGMARTGAGDGYWLLHADGRVAEFGAARDHGGLRACVPNSGARAIVGTKTDGFWILATRGTVHAFGDARSLGQPGPIAGDAAALIRAT
jgi:hypothetical protein